MKLLPLIGFALLLGACSTLRYEDQSSSQASLRNLLARATENPNDYAALRDLGVHYFHTRNYGRSKAILQKAFALAPSDAKTGFYLGMVLELENESSAALKIYEQSANSAPSSPYRKLTEGRYRLLTRELVQQEMRARLHDEKAWSNEGISARTVAVFPLVYQGSDPRYAPLGRGLSEMIIVDLGKISSLQVVERVRIQAVLDELALGEGQYVDSTSAPRAGKILQAGAVVAGAYAVGRDDKLRVDLAFGEIAKQDFPPLASKTDALRDFYFLEKDLVIRLVT